MVGSGGSFVEDMAFCVWGHFRSSGLRPSVQDPRLLSCIGSAEQSLVMESVARGWVRDTLKVSRPEWRSVFTLTGVVQAAITGGGEEEEGAGQAPGLLAGTNGEVRVLGLYGVLWLFFCAFM